MIELLVTLLLACILVYVVHLLIGMLALPPQVKQIAYIIIAVIVLFWLLDRFGLYTLR